MSTVPKSKSSGTNKTVFILLGAAAAIMLLCTGIFAWMVVKSLLDGGAMVLNTGSGMRPGGTFLKGDNASSLKSEEVMRAFLTELSAEQLEDAYQRTSTSFQSAMSQADFNAVVQKNKAIIGHLRINFKGTTRANNILVYKIHLGGGPNGAVDCTLELSQEAEGWRVSKFTVP